MRKPFENYILIVIFSSMIFGAGAFNLEIVDETQTQLSFSLTEIQLNSVDGHTHLLDVSAQATTVESGPELPVYTTMFQMDPGVEYRVEYTVLSSSSHSDITLTAAVSLDEAQPALARTQNAQALYQSHAVYPRSPVVLHEPMVMRGLEVGVLEVIPFQYHTGTRELTVYNQLDIRIIPSGGRPLLRSAEMPRSRTFEPLYETLLLNYEERDEEFQTPAILYICGGGSGGSITHPAFQEMIEWRHRRGWVVYTAHTGQTGSSNTQIKEYIQDAYYQFDPPPEIVGLVGDVDGAYGIPTFTDQWSWYNGPGDQPYALLNGDDMLPEVLVGRISVSNGTELSVVMNKVISYEKAVYMNPNDNWFERAALIGDPSHSGLSTITTNEYIQNMMENFGFEDVHTNYGQGNYASWMQNELNDGMLYFNYRGYLGTSGFGATHINNANNGYKLPFATFLTCGTGSFNYTAITETFLRAGTVSNPKGAIGAVGTATSGTHTAINNVVQMGIYDGIFSQGLETTGAATAAGKLNLLKCYPTDPSNWVSIFSYWNNLMGDPGVHLWTDTPLIVTAEYPETMGVGANFVDILVVDEADNPVANLWVTLVSEDDVIFNTALTADNGVARVDLDPSFTGTVYVTVTARNVKPYEGEFDISTNGPVVNLDFDSILIADNLGNADGLLNPGETVTLTMDVFNYGTEAASSVSGVLVADNPLVTVELATFTDISLSPGESTAVELSITLAPNALHLEELELTLYLNDDAGNTWWSEIPIDVYGPRMALENFDIPGQDYAQPGVHSHISVSLENTGLVGTGELTGLVVSNNSLLELPADMLSWPACPAQGTVNSNENFILLPSNDIINGSTLPLEIQITDENGLSQSVFIQVQVGIASVMDPLGPDNHGYYIYDSGDLTYNLALPYDWVEIDPDYGGPGTSLNMNDNGYGTPVNQQSAHVDLPFTFTFYGVDYDEIVVSTNGWISFGDTESEAFRNYPLPGAGGPSPMVAVFWDDLKTSNGGQVYKWINENDGYVVIEWSDMRTWDQSDEEDFQIILYDSVTPTGDDEMLLQYKEFNNTSIGNMNSGGVYHGGYSTVGIENHLATDGLTYTYDNDYPVPAMTLHDESALFITTRAPLALISGDVNQDGEVNILDIIPVVNDILNISSLGALERYIADVDGNGMLNILDVIHMINIIIEDE